MDIKALKSNEPVFSIDTPALGRINAFPLTIRQMGEIEKTDPETTVSFINSLIINVGRNSEGLKLTYNDVAKLSDADRHEFAKKFLEFNQYLFRERVRKERQNEEGHVEVFFVDGEIKHQRAEDEADSDYLFHLFKIHQTEWKEQARRITEPFQQILESNNRFFTPSFVDTFKKSLATTAHLGNMIDRLRIKAPDDSGITGTRSGLGGRISSEIYRPDPRVPDVSAFRNPVLDTNEKLSNVVSRLDSMEDLALQMAETVKAVSDSASRFLVDFGAASEKADRASRRAIWIAGTAIVVTMISTFLQIDYSERRVQRSQADIATAINTISNRIETGVNVHRERMGRIETELNKDNIDIKAELE